MSKLIYSINTSLDGYFLDAAGSFSWGEPSEEVHHFFNDLVRPIGTHLYGRRMYEVMSFWESVTDADDEPAVMLEFARIWQAAEKVVFSTTLTDVSTARTRLERAFTRGLISAMKANADSDIGIGGPELAGQAFAAGLIDEVHLVVVPVIVGGGSKALPDSVRLDLQLLTVDRFASGTVHLHYAVDETPKEPTAEE